MSEVMNTTTRLLLIASLSAALLACEGADSDSDGTIAEEKTEGIWLERNMTMSVSEYLYLDGDSDTYKLITTASYYDINNYQHNVYESSGGSFSFSKIDENSGTLTFNSPESGDCKERPDLNILLAVSGSFIELGIDGEWFKEMENGVDGPAVLDNFKGKNTDAVAKCAYVKGAVFLPEGVTPYDGTGEGVKIAATLEVGGKKIGMDDDAFALNCNQYVFDTMIDSSGSCQAVKTSATWATPAVWTVTSGSGGSVFTGTETNEILTISGAEYYCLELSSVNVFDAAKERHFSSMMVLSKKSVSKPSGLSDGDIFAIGSSSSDFCSYWE